MHYRDTVRGGSARASALGFPTANISLAGTSMSGIYAASVIYMERTYEALAYADTARDVLEVHLFNFTADLYGKEISVTLLEKLRESQVFDTEEELRTALANDAVAARQYFTH